MTSQSPPTSLALFGSAARGDLDCFSDRDLLIVMDDEAGLMAAKAHYDSAGWSCTAYSWKRLQRAADQGSLFVQHLKQESKIILDPEERLAGLLEKYSTKSSYRQEFEGAASLLGDLTQQLPACQAGPMWTMDVLSVGFRSLAVAELADHGIYSFANTDILGGLVRTGMICRSDAYKLQPLRQFKSLYRQGLIHGGVDWPMTKEILTIIDRTFALGFDTGRMGAQDVLDMALVGSSNARWSSDWYVRCRRIESALLMLKPREPSHHTDFTEQRQGLFKIVKSPNNYAWRFTRDYVGTQKSLADLAEICAL